MAKRQVSLRHTLTNSLGTLVSRALGILKWSVVNYLFGKNADPFHASFNQINNLRKLIAEGTVNNAFIPVFQSLRGKTGSQENDVNRFASTVINLFLIATLIIAAIGVWLAPIYVPWFVPGYHGPRLQSAVRLMQLMLPFTVFISLFSIAMGILNSHKRFGTPAFAPVLFNLSFILFPLFLYKQWGLSSLAVAVSVGGFLMFALELIELKQIGFRYFLKLDLRHPGLKSFFKLFWPTALNMLLLMALSFIFNRYMSYLPEGAFTVYRSAFVIHQAMIGISGVAVSTVILPLLSALKNSHDAGPRTSKILNEAGSILLFFLVPLTGLFMLYPDFSVNLLYRDVQVLLTGNSGHFDRPLLRETARALSLYAPGLLAFAFNLSLVKVFYARHDAHTPLLANTLMLVFSVTGYHISRHFRFGLSGIIITDVSVQALMTLFYFVKLRGLLKLGPLFLSLLKKTLQFSLISAALLALLLPLHSFYASQHNALSILGLESGAMLLFAALYFILTRLFGLGFKRNYVENP